MCPRMAPRVVGPDHVRRARRRGVERRGLRRCRRLRPVGKRPFGALCRGLVQLFRGRLRSDEGAPTLRRSGSGGIRRLRAEHVRRAALIAPRKAGRPRNPDVHEASLRSTAELLGLSGYANLSIEGVAQRAGVTRQSIYRRWPSKLALVAELLREVSESAPLPDTGSLRDDMRALYRLYARYLRTPGGPIIPALVAEAMHNDELASIVGAYVD